MSIVEQAAKRLEQLKRAGIGVPAIGADPQSTAVQPVDLEPTPAAAMRRLAQQTREGSRAAAAHTAVPAAAATAEVAPVARSPIPPVAHEATKTAHRGTATLDLTRLQDAGYLTPRSTRTLLAEELRHVKRPLLKNARSTESGSARLSQIMVTSALPGEGKTFFSINLAISMAAEIDFSVLLIDADVIHPTLFQRVGLQPGKGLLDLLTDPDLDFADVILDTNVPKLSILAAGTRNDRATELLASDSMEALLARLEQRYPQHIIIFDAPPLLVTNEAKVLATRVGQVVMVVEAAKTAKNLVAQAYTSVEHCPIVLSVLNKVPQTHAPLGYGYYYP
jgi:receptor protein-tyrosine kinase